MRKGKIMCVGIIVIVLVIVAMITAKNNHGKTEVVETSEVKTSDLVYRENNDSEDVAKEIFDNYEKNLNAADNLVIEKVIRTTVEDADGNSSTSYDSYIVSNVNFADKADDTEDFTDAVSAKEFDDSLIRQANFSESFGFSYEGLSAAGLYETLLDMESFNGNLTDVSLDEDRTKLTGQNNYILNDEGDIIEKLLPDYKNKDVIESKAYYQTMNIDGMEVPEFFVAVVKYRDGDDVIEKSIYLQISDAGGEVAL